MIKRFSLPVLFALVFASPLVAHAQRHSPLADAPAIRKRVEYRATRLDLGAGFGSTVNETFNHGLMANVHLGFHLTDWLSISGMAAFNVSGLATGFQERLTESLQPNPNLSDPTMARDVARARALETINKPSQIFAGQLEITPFTGKFALFGSLFAHYDFYVFGGVAAVNLVAAGSGGTPCTDNTQPMNTSNNDRACVVTGMKIGGTGGAGFHAFFNQFVALNVELRDFLIQDNPAGRDVNGDQSADNKDLSWTSHLMATVGVSLYLPTTAKITD